MNGKIITLVGVIATAIWLVLIAAYVWAKWPCFVTMEPNSLGDFVAGAFGPLALFWLVCGYFQQGIELRQNTKALQNQATELHNSVQHQEQMSQTAIRQLELEKEVLAANMARDLKAAADAEPDLELLAISHSEVGGQKHKYYVQLPLKNIGADLELLEYREQGVENVVSRGELGSMQTVIFAFDGPLPSYTAVSYIHLTLRDQVKRRHVRSIRLTPSNGMYSAELLPPDFKAGS